MSRVAIVTDCCASIPESLLEQLGLYILAYYIHCGRQVLRDLLTIQRDELLRWMRISAPAQPACVSISLMGKFK